MSRNIFMSYRRDDSAGHGGRVHDRLAVEFGRDGVFMDVDSIPLGFDFVEALRQQVARRGTVLALIGPDWVDARETPIVSPLAAVANAMEQATGIRFTELTMSPAKVLKALPERGLNKV